MQLEKQKSSELVLGLVGAVGTDLNKVIDFIEERLKAFQFSLERISVSENIISTFYPPPDFNDNEFHRISFFMDKGNELRNKNHDSVLALGAAAQIFTKRTVDDDHNLMPKLNTAHVIKSLKHPEEVNALREIYGNGFYLLGVFSEKEKRQSYLEQVKRISTEEAIKLIDRDENEGDHGQNTRDTFQMSDFFIHYKDDQGETRNSIYRIIDLVFGAPYIAPTFHEYAMYIAYASSLRSLDLSRQIGAVISKHSEILATGANDCPKAGGGLYWPIYDMDTKKYDDIPNGRDYKRGGDSNKRQQADIIDDIYCGIKEFIESLDPNKQIINDENITKLKAVISKSKLKSLTEYGRSVHAEMEALLMAARNNISVREGALYCTTMPCHNCAKHIIAAGIKNVYFIEPYPKSKTLEFYNDSIKQTQNTNDIDVSKIVTFTHYIGVGPRRFSEIFSMKAVYGYDIIRKEGSEAIQWQMGEAYVRNPMLITTYLERETIAAELFELTAFGGGNGHE